MNYLLDTSAFLAFYFGEPGRDRVGELLAEPRATIAVSALTYGEFWARLKAEGSEGVFRDEWAAYEPLFDRVLPVDKGVAELSVDLREAATARLPLIDALIAASAVRRGAVLVHRDPHFGAIPPDRLRQEYLGDG